MTIKLRELIQGISSVSVNGDLGTEIADLVLDSRKVASGSLFITLPGSHTDGNRYVKQAVDKGAAAILSELKIPPAPITLKRPHDLKPVAWIQVSDVFTAMGKAACNFFGDPSAGLKVLGVTGTNGKTTTTYFLESIISQTGGKPGVIGTVSYRLSGAVLEKAVNTTPYSLDLLRLLARMKNAGATHVVMEVSSHALATKRVEEVNFDAAVFTNLQRDHLDFHKTREEYFEAKARLFELLGKASSPKKRRVAVLNKDDDTYVRLKPRIVGAQTLSYGLNSDADFAAGGIILSLNGTRFVLRHADKQWAVTLKLVGEHNVQNALAAAAAAWGIGIDFKAILEGLAGLGCVPGRLEQVASAQSLSVLVDYAHTDAALASVLGFLKRLPHGRILTVFGCGGDRDRTKRGPMGVAACSASDLAFVTSDNPRSEDPMAIISEIEAGIRQASYQNYRIIPDRKEAIYEAIRTARERDIVLIAGKGHEDYQILRDRTIHFDDRETARAALKDCGKA